MLCCRIAEASYPTYRGAIQLALIQLVLFLLLLPPKAIAPEVDHSFVSKANPASILRRSSSSCSSKSHLQVTHRSTKQPGPAPSLYGRCQLVALKKKSGNESCTHHHRLPKSDIRGQPEPLLTSLVLFRYCMISVSSAHDMKAGRVMKAILQKSKQRVRRRIGLAS